MKRLLIAMLFMPGALCAQSPFDGTWVINSDSAQLSEKPEVYVLSEGTFCCFSSVSKVKADGHDHKVAASAYADTASVRVVDAHTVEVVTKKDDRVMYTEIYAVSADANTLTKMSKDTTEAEAVMVETVYQRVGKGPAGSHAISGSWRAYKSKRSKNGSIIKYKCTAEGFRAETPLGEKYYGKFDGQFYPTEDDPGHTLASAKLLDPNTVELTQKREGKISGILRLTVTPDGKSIHGMFVRKPDNAVSTFEMEKQQP
jgi:hypothetical protein